MTELEKRIADLILLHYDEDEYSYPYTDYRFYITGNGFITSQGAMTDVLFIHYTENEETRDRYIQVFLSSQDDDEQEFVYFSDLTEDERNAVAKQLFRECGTELAVE